MRRWFRGVLDLLGFGRAACRPGSCEASQGNVGKPLLAEGTIELMGGPLDGLQQSSVEVLPSATLIVEIRILPESWPRSFFHIYVRRSNTQSRIVYEHAGSCGSNGASADLFVVSPR